MLRWRWLDLNIRTLTTSIPILSLMFLGCNREDSFNSSHPSDAEFEKSFRWYIGHIDGLVELRELAISESFSNAYAVLAEFGK